MLARAISLTNVDMSPDRAAALSASFTTSSDTSPSSAVTSRLRSRSLSKAALIFLEEYPIQLNKVHLANKDNR